MTKELTKPKETSSSGDIIRLPTSIVVRQNGPGSKYWIAHVLDQDGNILVDNFVVDYFIGIAFRGAKEKAAKEYPHLEVTLDTEHPW